MNTVHRSHDHLKYFQDELRNKIADYEAKIRFIKNTIPISSGSGSGRSEYKCKGPACERLRRKSSAVFPINVECVRYSKYVSKTSHHSNINYCVRVHALLHKTVD